MKQVLRFNKVIKRIVFAGDLILLNGIFLSLYALLGSKFFADPFTHSLPQVLVLLNLCYLVSNMTSGVILHRRVVRPEQIVWRAIRNSAGHALFFSCALTFGNFGILSARFFLIFYLTFTTLLVCYRLLFRRLLKCYRKHGGNSRSIILVGSNSNIIELYHQMTDDVTSGFRVIGYFDDQPGSRFPEKVKYLGQPRKIVDYLKRGGIEQVYCCLPSARSEEILPIIDYCENHLIRFFSVPNVRSYLKRRMYFELLGNVPVLCIRQEPLSFTENRFRKRTFDIVFSLLFLCTLFPVIYIIVGLTIKITSPGPIFFKQKRSGEDGREFWCYKFRSMKVNAQSDTLQATLHDPRKTRFGNFLRKSSIDELPQFINVLLGDMSVVGPRPHMLKHTEQYSQLINKYMVRHFVKPGVTGWAQVTGFRGETHELWQMEGRVQRDIWYIEHWTFMLDLYIIYKTVRNALEGEKEAY
ncbi:undecaprenyl-phosphate glucose phosphotransferase [Bacteroides sp. FSHCM14E1]|uniref:undecaprenyl-phosphate glucose phosphotransferase n=1 Tax=Bacteroides sp. FSHCM14E1 TaxID=2784518 RepID=UPI001C730A37|nr:undecaprenyl-phosphate glucose phosphotransferase [Bacteroides sp. FSHCM14E1]